MTGGALYRFARCASISDGRVTVVIRCTSLSGTDLRGASVADLLVQDRSRVPIVTFCDAIDRLLGGGVQIGSVTEFCGVPGIGKTQLGIQLALDVQIPTELGGVGGRALYIDTEGSFSPERAAEMAEHVVQQIQKVSRARAEVPPVHVTADALLDGIGMLRVFSVTEQLAVVRLLPQLLRDDPRIRLVVFDSVSFHFRGGDDLGDGAAKARLLSSMAQELARTAQSAGVAVVLVNQVTTKHAAGEAHLVPALGESWAHAAAARVTLFWRAGCRYAHLFKSARLPTNTVPYRVTAAGIRDVERRRDASAVGSNTSPAAATAAAAAAADQCFAAGGVTPSYGAGQAPALASAAPPMAGDPFAAEAGLAAAARGGFAALAGGGVGEERGGGEERVLRSSKRLHAGP